MSAVTNQNAWLAEALSRLVLEAPENRLSDFDRQAIFDAPRMGVAAADDPVFAEFRNVVDARHFMPADLFGEVTGTAADPSLLSVVSWAFPFTEAIRRSNRGRRMPSQLYSLARNNGGALLQRLGLRLKEVVERRGFAVVIPTAVPQYDVFRSDAWGFSSTWSERHAAFAAGLGGFGLNGALITAVGANVRLLSIVTDLPLERAARTAGDHRAACARGGGCSQCIANCPVGAVSRNGLDKEKCYAMRNTVREEYLELYARNLAMLAARVVKSGKTSEGYSLGCALCQCGVPCEGRAPGP